MYGAIMDGYVLEVHVSGMKPTGPDTPGRPGWVPDGAGGVSADDFRGPGRGVGPQDARASRVCALLRELDQWRIYSEK